MPGTDPSTRSRPPSVSSGHAGRPPAPPHSHETAVRSRRKAGRPAITLAAYWILLFAATHYPRVELRGLPQQSDKWVHFLAYALLAWLFWRWWRGSGRANAGMVTIVVLSAYAAIDEWTQGFVGRGTDSADWLADVAGVCAVVGLLECRRWRAGRADRMRSGADDAGGRAGANRD
ncbi:MAG: VanZ family protein [Phycisphaerales bacterium]|nr:VanZ family protein [Phycisphaerales bacterium]